jgi:heme-degrading monooxygenase HmoA
MIARLWFARTNPSQVHTYLDHFSNEVLPKLRAVDGYISSMVLTRPTEGEVEILVTTIWRSFEAIDGFAGPDRAAAVVAGDAAALLTGYDRRVRHFEFAFTDGLPPV